MGFANDTNYSGLTGILAPLNGTPTKIQPTDTLQGFKPNQPISAQNINWICNKAISVVGDPIFGLGGDGDLVIGSSDVTLAKDAEFGQISWSTGATGKLRTNGFRLRALVIALANAPSGAISGDGSDSVVETVFNQPGSYNFVVPAGVTSLNAVVFGAHGGRNTSGTSNGRGGRGQVTGTIPVTPGETLTLTVGAAGQDFSGNTTNGAGGGGYSAIQRATLVLIAAGGGGGSGGSNCPGGNGGGTTGGNGGGSNATGGRGGTPSAGGALGATGFSFGLTAGGTAGSPYTGGNGVYSTSVVGYDHNGGFPGGGHSGRNALSPATGGGGGGGLFGGGGGSANLVSGTVYGAGGGGGSSHADPSVTSVTHNQGTTTTAAALHGAISFTSLAATAAPNGISGTQGWGQGGLAPGAAVSNYAVTTGGVGGDAGGAVSGTGSGARVPAGKRDVSPLGPTTSLTVCGLAGASGPDAVGMPTSPSGGCYVSIRAALIIRDATAAAGCISSRGGAGLKPSGTFATGFGNGPGGGGGGVVDLVYGDLTGPTIVDAIDASGGAGGAGGNAASGEGAGGGTGGEGGKIFIRNLFVGDTQRVLSGKVLPGTQIANGGGTTGGAGSAGGVCKADL